MSDLFWSKVLTGKPDDCWPWQGALNSHGYGNLTVGQRYLRAHRVAYELSKGPIPDGLFVCHSRCNGYGRIAKP